MIQPSFLFTDHAVLQRGKRVCVFGECDCENLTVSFASHSVRAEIDGMRFMAYLPPMEAGICGELVFSSKNEKVVCHDVVTGDVWLCAGQSNMEHPAFATLYEQNDFDANDQIRLFTVPRRRNQTTPEWGWHFQAVLAKDTPWVCFGGEDAKRFSGVGVHFGKELCKHVDVPIGLIACNLGATYMESWISRESLLSDPITRYKVDEYDAQLADLDMREYEKTYAEYRQKLLSYMEEYGDEMLIAEKMGGAYSLRHGFRIDIPAGPYATKVPANCFENMLKRVAPFAVSGVLWYQGESNTYDTPYGHNAHFKALFEMLVREWRKLFNDEKLPFYTVQLAVYTYRGLPETKKNWAEIREAQEELARTLDGVYMVSALDIGEFDNIHPIDKKTVGQRLACAVLANQYGQEIAWQGPSVRKLAREGTCCVLDFDHATSLVCSSEEPQGFYLFLRDGSEQKAKARIDGTRVIVDCEDALAIGYCYRNYASADMYNELGLPMLPFYRILDF